MYGVACVQTGHCGPHLHSSSAGLLFWACVQMGHCDPQLHSSSGLLFWGLFSIRLWGITACFGGVFSVVLSVLTEVGIGTSSI